MNIRYDAEKGMSFLEDIRLIYNSLIASIDEMSVMINAAPTYGYASRGQMAVIS